jgi:EAL domain-containing protein (putative c-di-GMP-specific phosphodiesterase class I)
LRTNVITGFEALARWRHPTKGMVPPALFIPVAEDSELIVPLGEWALREACRKAVQWPGDLRIAVNLSPKQFMSPGLFHMVEQALKETNLAPQRLELEITERIFMEDNDNTLSTLRRLKELGVRISLDDFGTGYSSLSYLRSFPFDKIKVDRTFVSDLKESSEHIVIVQAVVSIARALGMTTTAEGVETEDQQKFLRRWAVTSARLSPAPPSRSESPRSCRVDGTEALAATSAFQPTRATVPPSLVPEQEQSGSDHVPTASNPIVGTRPIREANHQATPAGDSERRYRRGGARGSAASRSTASPATRGDSILRRPASASGNRREAGRSERPRRTPSATSAACSPIFLVMPRTATVTLPYIMALAS